MRKVTFLMGAAVGYVLGAKAGRERYEQIAAMAGRARDNPRVQHATEAITARGSELMHDAVDKAAAKAPDWVPGSRHSNSDTMTGNTTGTPAPAMSAPRNGRGRH